MLFSEDLLEICNDNEVSAICAHELAHLTESKAILFRRVVGSFALFPLVFVKPVFHASGQLAPMFLLLPVLLSFLIRGLSIRMERRADRVATDNQSEPGVYRRALEKLCRENLVPVVNAGNRQSHPHLYDRLQAAGIAPDYPKPPPPHLYSWTSWLLLASIFLLPIFVGMVEICLFFANAVIGNL